jgi:hypothetical protein
MFSAGIKVLFFIASENSPAAWDFPAFCPVQEIFLLEPWLRQDSPAKAPISACKTLQNLTFKTPLL